MAKKMVLDGGYPEEDLIEVEALRYLHLNQTAKHKAYLNVSGVGEMTLLVLGDYLKENTMQQMELLRIAALRIDKKIKYIIKPHPACPILVGDYPELDLTITNDPIPMLIDHCSLVYTSSITSAAVDAYCAGKPVVTALDPKSLNLSPLKGSEGVSFVSSPEALAVVLNRMGQMKEIAGQGKDYFYLDPNLSRWQRLLKQSGNSEL
jgi:surface carbohydrate biosynthesis protein (TIGR04326 family)